MSSTINYHHYSLTFDPEEVRTRFNDVRFVLVAGSPHRVEAHANYLARRLFDGSNGSIKAAKLERLTKDKSRFTLLKLGPCLMSDHGMGGASMSIAMHELFVMCNQAQVTNQITVIRFGTCGGIGVPAGTVCITDRALDPLLQDFIELKICMQLVRRPCVIDMATVSELERICRANENKEELGVYDICKGATISSNDFYEEQGRTNGAICDHSIEDKDKFLERAHRHGVINMEMECSCLAAMCHKIGVRFVVLDVALTNRLAKDQVELTSEQVALFEQRLFWNVFVFIRHKLTCLN